MIRPLLLLCCCAALLAGGRGRAQDARETARPLSARDALPELPVNGLLDEANVFGEDEEALLAADLEVFQRRAGLPLYVVTANYILGGSVEEFSERMIHEGLKGRAGVVLIYERGSGQLNYSATPGALGRSEDMKLLFLAGSRAAASLPAGCTTAQRLRAAVQALTLAAAEWKTSGLLPDPNAPPLVSVPEPPPPPAAAVPATAPPPAAAKQPPPPGWMQGRVMTGIVTAVLAGAALLFGFHRWQERFESRLTAQYHFPDVRVGRRLGAPQGGGVTAAISFKEKR